AAVPDAVIIAWLAVLVIGGRSAVRGVVGPTPAPERRLTVTRPGRRRVRGRPRRRRRDEVPIASAAGRSLRLPGVEHAGQVVHGGVAGAQRPEVEAALDGGQDRGGGGVGGGGHAPARE